jgi:hypothetical protein
MQTHMPLYTHEKKELIKIIKDQKDYYHILQSLFFSPFV